MHTQYGHGCLYAKGLEDVNSPNRHKHWDTNHGRISTATIFGLPLYVRWCVCAVGQTDNACRAASFAIFFYERFWNMWIIDSGHHVSKTSIVAFQLVCVCVCVFELKIAWNWCRAVDSAEHVSVASAFNSFTFIHDCYYRRRRSTWM